MQRLLENILKITYFKIVNLVLVFFIGCAQMTSLGLKKHQFGVQPSKIIWIQIAGLEEQHLAMMKFTSSTIEQKSEFENFLCLGKMWNFNLYNLRNKSSDGLLSQITGSKNIKKECSDYQQKPIWNYLIKSGYKAAVFENYADKNSSLFSAENCPDKEAFTKDLTAFISSPFVTLGEEKFHATEEIAFKNGEKYNDRSCDKKGCFTSINENVFSVYKRFAKNKSYFLFNVRDFSFERAIREKKFKKAKRILMDISNLITLLNQEINYSDTLMVVSSSSPLVIDFPKEGRDWKQFEEKEKASTLKNDSLFSLALASGARAENFCGIFDESEILSRILSGPKQQGLEFIILNPFN